MEMDFFTGGDVTRGSFRFQVSGEDNPLASET
jgi:hypothetical protein